MQEFFYLQRLEIPAKCYSALHHGNLPKAPAIFNLTIWTRILSVQFSKFREKAQQ